MNVGYHLVYDEQITPYENCNKVARVLNTLVADEANVKEVVDRLLSVYKENFLLKAGYCEPIKAIATPNPISGSVTSRIPNVINRSSMTGTLTVTYEGEPDFFQWQYKRNGQFVDLDASGSNTTTVTVNVTFYKNNDSIEFRCKLQNSAYTYYTPAYKITCELPYSEIVVQNGATFEENEVSLICYRTKSATVHLYWSLDSESWTEVTSQKTANVGQDTVTYKWRPYILKDSGALEGVVVGDATSVFYKTTMEADINKDEHIDAIHVEQTVINIGDALVNGVNYRNYEDTTNMPVVPYDSEYIKNNYPSYTNRNPILFKVGGDLLDIKYANLLQSVSWHGAGFISKITSDLNNTTVLYGDDVAETKANSINSDIIKFGKTASSYVYNQYYYAYCELMIANTVFKTASTFFKVTAGTYTPS